MCALTRSDPCETDSTDCTRRVRLAQRAFSNLSLTGEGFIAVMDVAISLPIAKADSFERPGSSTKRLSVSPYTTRAFHEGWLLTWLMAASSVARPVPTMASASSAMGMRPEKPAVTRAPQRVRHRPVPEIVRVTQRACAEKQSTAAAGRTRGGVAVRDVGDELERKLARVECALQHLVPPCRLEGALDHDSRLQDLPKQPRQHALAHMRRDERHAVARDAQVVH